MISRKKRTQEGFSLYQTPVTESFSSFKDPYSSEGIDTESDAKMISPRKISSIALNKDNGISKEEGKKISKNFITRAIWTLVMILSFIGIISSGHKYAVFLVIAIQTLVFKELIALAHYPSQQKQLPWFRTITWYFLFTTNYFLYGESFFNYFKKFFLLDAFLLPLATHHRFISFILYILGIVMFVLNLKKGFYKFQFGQFAWTHMCLLLIVIQAHFVINNIFEGLIWFILPVTMVIVNDIFAYIIGILVGRTPLIKLSPKKTWEGFIGAFITTLIFAFFFSRFLAKYDHYVCPVEDWRVYDSATPSSCERNPVFIPKPYALPPFLFGLLKHLTGYTFRSIYIAPIQWHALIMSIFASLIAPFGGFFASGVKRAFKIKDFSDSIPGHGGITDRFDCQFVMGAFSYMYISSFIKVHQTSVAGILHAAVAGLSSQDQLELYHSLRSYLINQGLL